MGKTLGAVLAVAAAVAVNVIPGAQGWASGVILSATGTGFAAVGTVFAAVGIASAAITAYGLSRLAGLLGMGPNAPKPQTTESAIKASLPPRVSAYGKSRLYGAYVLYETASNGTAVDVFAIHDGPATAIDAIYLGDEQVTLTGSTVNEGVDGRYADGAVNIYYTLGQAVETAFAAVISLLPGIWTSGHRGDGVVALAATFKSVKSKNYQDVYPSGLPPAASLVGRWQKVFDWRDGPQGVNNPDTWRWSENAVLHLAHYILVREKARKLPGEIFPSADALLDAWSLYFQPAIAYWTAAADDADTAMSLKSGGTEPRYRSCFAHKHIDDHKSVKTALLACFDGWLAPRSDGALIVYSGRYYSPTVTIGPDEIVSYTWEAGVDDEAAVNEIAVSYVSAAHDYNSVEADAWRDDDDISARGQIRADTFAPQVPSHAQVRRLAKRIMAKTMAPYRGTVTTNAAGRIARGQRYIHLNISEAGAELIDGPVEITQLTRNLATGGVTFSWISADPNVDSWNPATEEGLPAALGERVAPEPLAAPLIIDAEADFSDIGDGVSGVRIIVTGTGPDRSDLTWYARWRVGSGAWSEVEYPDEDPTGGVTLTTEYVAYGADVDVEIAYSIGDGRVSPWSATETVDTSP